MSIRFEFTLKSSAVAMLAGLSATAALLVAAPAMAADSGAKAGESADNVSLEEVVVTGSRIRGEPPVGSALISVGRDDIIASGAMTATEIVQSLPQVLNFGISSGSRIQSGGSNNVTYGSSVNIRGIGPFATLALVNGHRVVPQGTTGFAVDPSVIPTIGLERLEVIADGASAIYGSDAIAGVANFILRRNFEGLEANARYGLANGHDARQIGLIGGHRWSGGQLTVAAEYSFQSALSGLDRPYEGNLASYTNGISLSTQCNPGNITAAGVTYPIPAGGLTAANRASLVAGTTNKCNNNVYADIFPEQQHKSLDFTFNQNIGERVSVFADGLYSRRTFLRQVPAATSTITVPSTNAYFVAPPGTTPATETVAYSFAKDYVNPPVFGFSNNYSITAGFDVKLPASWKFAADYMVGRNDDLAEAYGSLNAAALTTALASSNPAVAFNPFGGTNSAAVLAPILIGFTYQPGRTTLRVGEVKADGPLFRLPGGEVRAALGYEAQHMIVAQGQDTGTLLARVIGPRPHRYRNVDSYYAEVLFPLVSAANARAGLRKLDINIAGRTDRYSDVGNTSNPKIGVNWSPLNGLMFHGSYGTSFRAPTISQIYGNSSALFVQNYSDPLLNGATRVGVALSGGNLSLKPETAKTYSFGVDFEPAALAGSRFSVTYFDVEYDDQVANYLSNLNVLFSESLLTGTPVIQRNPSAALVASLIATYPVNAGVLPATWTLFVDGRNLNLGKSRTSGIDFDVSYRIPTEKNGNFGVGLVGTYLTAYKGALSAAAPLVDQRNTINNPLGFRTRGNLSWSKGGWSAVGFVNYTNGYLNNSATVPQDVRPNTTLDTHVGYDFGGGQSAMLRNVRVAVDVSNLFDTLPPFVNVASSNNAPGGFDPTAANPLGRLVSLSINKRL